MPSSAHFTRGATRRDGGEIAWWTAGPADAPWLVLSHGGALDHRGFRPWARRLADDWRVLLWDLPGHGESQPRPALFTADACAEALAAVMDDAGVDAGFQFGFSFGGMVAQIFAKAHPARTTGLGAYGCFTPHLRPPLIPTEQAAATADALFGALTWAEIVADFSRRCCLTPAGRAEVARAMGGVGRDGFLAMTAALFAASDYDPEFRVSGPVLTVVGAKDSNGAALEDAMAAVAAAYPEAERIVIAEAGHCAHLDRPETFDAEVSPALARCRARLVA
ncbi:MAG: alpha/beta fold hydrolase [Phenylobacterium sp.]